MRSYPRSLPSLEINGRVPLNLLWSAPISTAIHVIVYSPVENARKVILGQPTWADFKRMYEIRPWAANFHRFSKGKRQYMQTECTDLLQSVESCCLWVLFGTVAWKGNVCFHSSAWHGHITKFKTILASATTHPTYRCWKSISPSL